MNANVERFPFRKVISTEELTNKYCRPGEGCRRFNLECGHWTIAKQSNGNPRRKRCRDCADHRSPEPQQFINSI
jgi:hypothetical protein